MDITRRSPSQVVQFGYWWKTIIGESLCILWSWDNTKGRIVIQRIQGCLCLDIWGFERDTTPHNMALNWIG
jgi:hypothetical protein